MEKDSPVIFDFPIYFRIVKKLFSKVIALLFACCLLGSMGMVEVKSVFGENSTTASNLSFQADIFGDSDLETISYVSDLTFHSYGGFGTNAWVVGSNLQSGDGVCFAVSYDDNNSFVLGVSPDGASFPVTNLIVSKNQYSQGQVENDGDSQLIFSWETFQNGYHIKLHKNAKLIPDSNILSGFKYEESFAIENLGENFELQYFIEYLHSDDNSRVVDYDFDGISETLLDINDFSTSGYPIIAKVNVSTEDAFYSIGSDSSHYSIRHESIIKDINQGNIIEIAKSVYVTSLAKNAELAESQIATDASYILSQPRCEVPFYWQEDPNGIDEHPLHGCGVEFDTLGEGGCTLTSATMLFRHYGVFSTSDGSEMTPPNLSDCMGFRACPFDWGMASNCSSGKAAYVNRVPFTYVTLDEEINANNRPVILGMCKPKGNCSLDGHYYDFSHWVLVVAGQGSDPVNYLVWDPGNKCGQNVTLSSLEFNDWKFDTIAIYQGAPICAFPSAQPSSLSKLKV